MTDCGDDHMINVPVLFCMHIEATGNTFYIMPAVNAVPASAALYLPPGGVCAVVLIAASCFQCARDIAAVVTCRAHRVTVDTFCQCRAHRVTVDTFCQCHL